MTTAIIVDVIREHRLGFQGVCTDDRGLPCGWKARRGGTVRGSHQHDEHVAALIFEAVRV